MNWNKNQTIMKNYILIVRTIHGNPEENVTVCVRGSDGQTERMLLRKSQSYSKAFRDNQTDVFALVSSIDVGKIYQVEFYANTNAKFKEWKYNHVLVINGTHVYHNIFSEYSLVPSTNLPSVVHVSQPLAESQKSIYYAFVKTGSDSCPKEAYPKLSLFGNNQKQTEIDLKSSYALYPPSANHHPALQKSQFDIFQWQSDNIGSVERMCLQLISENKQSKCQWPIEWILVIHNGYSFTGRIRLNRIVKIDRCIDIDLEEKLLPMTGEYGDWSGMEKSFGNHLTIVNQQANAATDDLVGRYYVFLRNMEGTTGNVYMEFHGDRLASSGEEHLSKCENYPDHPFTSKHTDLFHVKTFEVGRIQSVSMRLDQTTKEHSLTLDSLYIIHNAVMYQFDLKYLILNKEQPKKNFIPRIHSKMERETYCYYIATHTVDKTLSRSNTSLKILVTGSLSSFGPIELKESLTNGSTPFEKECIDLFHIDTHDIGDPLSMTLTVEPKGLASHLFTDWKCERMMLIKNGQYNSLWRLVGDLKSKEPTIIPLPVRPRASVENSSPHSNTTRESLRPKISKDMFPSITPEQQHSPVIPIEEKIEIKSPIIDIQTAIETNDDDASVMTLIEDHQKQHRFASSLYEAEQNYRELRRLLKKTNRPVSNEQKIRN